jgi:hypothetical protein
MVMACFSAMFEHELSRTGLSARRLTSKCSEARSWHECVLGYVHQRVADLRGYVTNQVECARFWH